MKNQNYKNGRVYAEGFGPESKLAKFFKTPVSIPPKTSGIVSLLIAAGLVASGISVSLLFFQGQQLDQTAIIGASQMQTMKTTTAVAGGNPVEWTTLVKASDVDSSQYLLKLPKGATNIKITTITAKQAKDILSAKPKEQLSLKQKQSIAVAIENKSMAKKAPQGLLNKFSSFFAGLEQLASDAVQNITETIIQNQSEDSDSTIVDLSQQSPVETPSVETPVETPAPAEIPSAETPIPAETPPSEVPPSAEVPSAEVSPAETPAPADQFVQITYETPAPVITEQTTDTGKLVTVSSNEQVQDPTKEQAPLTDVLAFTNIPEIYKVGQESKIKIKWTNNGDQQMEFHAYDLNGNGKLDYVEWTVPHLSDQIFEIIFISKAFQLDENQNIVADIYDTVATLDGNYATVPQNNYVRVTFYKTLTSANDITVYAKPAESGTPSALEVYPVYDDGNGNLTQGPKLDLVNDGTNPDFSNIDHDGKYRVLLQNLPTPTDIFDLKVVTDVGRPQNSGVDFDYIVDPPDGAPSVTEPVNSSSIGNLQTIIGTPTATTQNTATLFNYLRKLEQDRLNTAAGSASENATDAGKLEDLLGTSAVADNRVTIFDYIHKIYTALVNLVAGNIKTGVTIGGVTGTYQSGLTLKTGQVTSYSNNDDGSASYQKGIALAYTDNGDGTVTDNNTNLMWVKQPELIIPNSVAVLSRGAWATSTAYALNDMVKAVQFSGVNASRSAYTVTAASGTPFDTSCVGREVFIGGVSQGIIKSRTNNTVVVVSETGTTVSGALTVQSYYKCIIAHTSGTFLTDLGNLDWKERPSRITVAGGDWAPSTAYAMGTVVRDAAGSNSTAMNISAVSAAAAAVVTVDNLRGITSGQLVYISGISAGDKATILNSHYYYVLVNVTGLTLTLYSDAICSTGVSTVGATQTVTDGTAIQNKFYVSAVATTLTGNGTLALDIAANPTWWIETIWTASAATLTTPSAMAFLPTNGDANTNADAINNCENLSYAGYIDWRLPNVKEFFNIVVEEAGSITGVKASGAPYINQTVFSNTVSYHYWSSTTAPSSTTYAFYVHFNYGYASYNTKTTAYYVRCVRGQ